MSDPMTDDQVTYTPPAKQKNWLQRNPILAGGIAIGVLVLVVASASGGSDGSSPTPAPSATATGTENPDVELVVSRYGECILGAGGEPSQGRVAGVEDGRTVVTFGSLRFLVTHSGDRTYTVPGDDRTARKISAAGDTC